MNMDDFSGEEEYFFPYPFVGSDESTVNSNMLVVAKHGDIIN